MPHTIAGAFVDARRNWKAVAEYPGEKPSDLASAYAIQDCALSIWQRPVGGWKVGKIPSPKSTELGVNRLVGPVFADLIREETGELAKFPIFEEGFAAVEAEFMLRLAPKQTALPSTPDEAVSWVDEIRIGLEIASSPYVGINDDGPCVTVSDHGNNAGLLLGQKVPRNIWPSLDEISVTVVVEGQQVASATTATMLDGPFGAVCFLLANLRDRGIAPEAGWWVSSGAITGVHEVSPGQTASASFAGLGEIAARVVSPD